MQLGPVAIVTGGSRGIGKQTCLELARRGFRLVVASRTEAARAGTPGTLGQTLQQVRDIGAEAIAVRADMAEQSDLDRLVATALDRFGAVDALVNNAAYTVGRTLFTHVPDLTREQWDKHFAVNVTAPLMLIQACWQSMISAGRGVIVNLTSGAAHLQPIGQQHSSELHETGPAYGASKAALNRMCNVVAREGASYRIAVIGVNPGFVLTETMALTLGSDRIDATTAIATSVPASVIAHLCACADPMQFSGTIVDAEVMHADLVQKGSIRP